MLALNLPLILQPHTRVRLRGENWVKFLISSSTRKKDVVEKLFGFDG